MDYNLIIAVVVPLGVIAGFVGLGRTLLDHLSARQRRTKASEEGGGASAPEALGSCVDEQHAEPIRP
jgi:hypothetical protein